MADTAEEWVIDSGCSHHMTWCRALFQNSTRPFWSGNFEAANGSLLTATHIGDIGSLSNELFIPDTYLVPGLTCNLLSVGQLCNQGARFIFTSSGCIIEDPSGHEVGRGHKDGNHFILDKLNMFRPQEMASERNSSSKREQRNAASDSLTASSETNNKRRLIRGFEIPSNVPQLETYLRRIESELQRLQVIRLDRSCATCLDCDEDIRHLLFTCPFARMCWLNSPLAQILDCVTSTFTFQDFDDWILKTQEDLGEDIWNIVACIVQSIWHCRDEMAYEGEKPNAQRFKQILVEVTALSVFITNPRGSHGSVSIQKN